jgi:hypothetical protein
MKVQPIYLLRQWRHVPLTTLIRVIGMAGITAINSKIRSLNRVARNALAPKVVSVVHYDENGVIYWPENPNPGGVLVVPRPCTAEEWQRKGRELLQQRQGDKP